ncbi:MAG: GspE/PulE family protein [Defluviitaleaceae bacterium]|nr:GspE/PulE family protein [Defluviitaleaceae bacterium]
MLSGALRGERRFSPAGSGASAGLSLAAHQADDYPARFGSLSETLRAEFNIETCELAGLAVDADAAKALGLFLCERHAAIPVKMENGRLFVAMGDPLDARAIADIADATGLFVWPLLAREDEIRFQINKIFGSERLGSIESQFIDEEGHRGNRLKSDMASDARLRDAPAVKLVDSLIESAAIARASDIHIEPGEKTLTVRFRADGRLSAVQKIDISMHPNVISRLKVMGNMDIAEKRVPQDGRFTDVIQGEKIEFRLSTLPTIYGEKAALRLLYGRTARFKKEGLGFFADDLEKLTGLFSIPYGAIFITGPTGCGKSTTLKCFLEELNTGGVNIVTVEDPVENPIPGVNHMNVEPGAGLGFANSLRSILRQDPDIIMVGEIRDAETARIAIQAAITGHLVLSTLHTNDAAGVMERLVDMGIEPYMVASALSGIISQRLVRRLCENCKEQTLLTPEEALLLGVPEDAPAWIGKGCGRCGDTGYKGRFAVYEYILMDEGQRRKMIKKPEQFTARARLRDGAGLRGCGVRNVREGNTSASEIIRALKVY